VRAVASAQLPAELRPRSFPAEAPDAALRRAALAAFRSLPVHSQLQADYARWRRRCGDATKVPRWDEADGVPRLAVMRAASTALVSVSAGVWIAPDKAGCGDSFQTSLWALFEVTGSGTAARLRLRSRPAAGLSLTPLAASDLDGDGQLELLIGGFGDQNQPNAAGQAYQIDHGILRARDGSYEDLEGLELPVLICPA